MVEGEKKKRLQVKATFSEACCIGEEINVQ